MQKLLSALALLASLSPLAFAQIHVDQHDGTTDFTSRGFPATVDGWAHNAFKVDRQGGGIGGRGLVGWSTTVQDQNCVTIETWQFAIFRGNCDRVTGLPRVAAPSWGAPDSWPDANSILAATARFIFVTQAPVPCAWIFTTNLATPLDMSNEGDLFTATFLASNLGWTNDGQSSHISIAQPVPGAATREYPLTSADATTQQEMSNEFGICWSGLGPAAGGAVWTPAAKRYWLNRLRYDHTSRAGVEDTSGQFGALFGALGPQNFGMAGAYPDAANITGQPAATPRADELIWSDQHAFDFAAGQGYGQVLLATTMLRDVVGAPLVLSGTGLLELNPSDPLFGVGASIPGLQIPIVNLGAPTIYDPTIPLTQQPGIAPILHLNRVDVYAQVVRVDLTIGAASLGSCDSHSFRW
ncbi:MAG: hypothetical protein JNM84_12635 [Planctomycetes bacterium]|nr:hypothetical protein [Planctomycetota bacterium]